MIYNIPTNVVNKSVLVDIASALVNGGELDIDVLTIPTYPKIPTTGETWNESYDRIPNVALLNIETTFLPTNGAEDLRNVLVYTDKDKSGYFKTEDKAVENNLILINFRPGVPVVGNNPSTQFGNQFGTSLPTFMDVAETYLNEIRKVAYNCTLMQFPTAKLVDIIIDEQDIIPTNTTWELNIIAYGYLKETQTIDYNPLDQLNQDLNPTILMCNPNLVIE